VITTRVPDGHVWLRLTKPHYANPFDTSYAQREGGRWNPPASWPTLYLNQNMTTVHAQVRHLFLGRGVEPDDLDDNAPMMLAAATLPRRQDVADAITAAGIKSIGLRSSYPFDVDGGLVDQATTQPIGTDVKSAGLRGVWCRSAAVPGNEFAWFPATRATARPVWPLAKPYGSWRYATTIDEVQ